MPISHDYALLDPSRVQIPRSDRQRRVVDTRDLADSIRRNGVLNPIIVTRDLVLVAGERRLTACLELGIQVPVRFHDELSQIETQILELEENVKRSDLPWQDAVRAVGRIHDLYSSTESTWTQTQTGAAIGLTQETISKMLRVSRELDSPKLAAASGWMAAYNILARADERKLANVMAEIIEAGDGVFADLEEDDASTEPNPGADPDAEPDPDAIRLPLASSMPASPRVPPAPPPAILHADFLAWAPTYSGQRFNLIHCDFPYGINAFSGGQMSMSRTESDLYADDPDVYWRLIDCLCENIENIAAHSAHLMFWFSMQYYTKTLAVFREKLPSFEFNPMPLVWVKSDNAGVAPVPTWTPRQIYETALLGRRGERPIVKVVSNAIAAPTNKTLHPSAKPEPVLKHFFQMLVDETTRLLDPTCGSGTAVRAAEASGAASVLGLEVSAEHYENAAAETRKFRALRQLAGG